MAQLKDKITELMLQKRISAVDIEKMTGLNRNTIYGIMAGNSKSPSAHNLQLIAKALNVTLESILTGKEDETNTQEVLSNEQIRAFEAATSSVVNIIIERELNFPIETFINLIKEVYQYSIKVSPPHVEDRFIHWILDKYNV